MAETIQSFVTKLQQEGVEAGEKQAEELRRQAQKDAEKIVADAQQEAEKIVANAKQEAQQHVERSQTELNLAARDTVLKLRDSLNRALQSVVRAGTQEALDNVDFLGKVLHEVITSYAQSDREGTDQIRITVKPELRDQLVDWALGEIGRKEGKHVGIDLKGTLKQSGFEYTCAGATVEVTLDSVVEMLTDMVSPKLRETLDQAVETEAKSEPEGE